MEVVAVEGDIENAEIYRFLAVFLKGVFYPLPEDDTARPDAYDGEIRTGRVFFIPYLHDEIRDRFFYFVAVENDAFFARPYHFLYRFLQFLDEFLLRHSAGMRVYLPAFLEDQ